MVSVLDICFLMSIWWNSSVYLLWSNGIFLSVIGLKKGLSMCHWLHNHWVCVFSNFHNLLVIASVRFSLIILVILKLLKDTFCAVLVSRDFDVPVVFCNLVSRLISVKVNFDTLCHWCHTDIMLGSPLWPKIFIRTSIRYCYASDVILLCLCHGKCDIFYFIFYVSFLRWRDVNPFYRFCKFYGTKLLYGFDVASCMCYAIGSLHTCVCFILLLVSVNWTSWFRDKF